MARARNCQPEIEKGVDEAGLGDALRAYGRPDLAQWLET
jgi:hypothetical protein